MVSSVRSLYPKLHRTKFAGGLARKFLLEKFVTYLRHGRYLGTNVLVTPWLALCRLALDFESISATLGSTDDQELEVKLSLPTAVNPSTNHITDRLSIWPNSVSKIDLVGQTSNI